MRVDTKDERVSRSLGLALGVLLDAAWGDPRRGHPVALFGAWAAGVEQRLYADSVGRGVAHLGLTVTPVLALGVAAEWAGRRRPLLHTGLVAATTWAVLGARSLATEGVRMADALDAGDLHAARATLPSLCGRDPTALDAPELARATVESLAENTNDAVVCSLFWGAVAGIPGLVAHRAVNTLDAMVGHRTPRHGRFGAASARTDDTLAWLPARLTAALAALGAPLVGGSTAPTWATVARDAADHPSPNGGWCEAAWAGALGVRLGGTNTYGDRVEVRGTLGEPDAPRPGADAVRRAVRLSRWVTAAATVLAVGLARR